MKRIFIIGYSKNKGGVESYIVNLNKKLNHDKYEVIYTMPIMNIDGKTWVRPKNRHNYIKYRSFWKKFYQENHIDILYYNTCDIVSISQLKFAKGAGVPVRIIHAHNTGNQQGIQKRMSFFHRLSERRSRRTLHKYATHFFACSKSAGDWMFDGRKYQIIHNGINLVKYQYSEHKRKRCREILSLKDEILIGCIGRLSPQKNPLYTVDIVEAIAKKIQNVKVVMIGEGEMREDLEQMVKKKGLRDKVIFTGAVDNVHEWLSAIDCLLMPSLFEGLPFVLVEAQAAGLHCVVSSAVSEEANITGLVEYISLEENVEHWAEKVLEACKRPRKDVTRNLIAAGYSIEDTASEVSEIIESALK